MKKLILFSAIVISLGVSLYLSRNLISPYETFNSAKSRKDNVQIIGIPDRKNSNIYDNAGCLLINLSDLYDSSAKLTVKYCGSVPEKIHHSDKIVAHGKYNPNTSTFDAARLYYKCPSKYQKANP